MDMVMSIVREHLAYTILVFLAGAVGMAIAGYGIYLIIMLDEFRRLTRNEKPCRRNEKPCRKTLIDA